MGCLLWRTVHSRPIKIIMRLGEVYNFFLHSSPSPNPLSPYHFIIFCSLPSAFNILSMFLKSVPFHKITFQWINWGKCNTLPFQYVLNSTIAWRYDIPTPEQILWALMNEWSWKSSKSSQSSHGGLLSDKFSCFNNWWIELGLPQKRRHVPVNIIVKPNPQFLVFVSDD